MSQLARNAAILQLPQQAVIQSKIAVPPLAATLVSRPRVEDKLVGLIERNPIVVVAATAGAGKTTAVATALRQLDRPVAWLTVDRTDAAPGRLLTYLEAAIARVDKRSDIGSIASAALTSGLAHAEAAGMLVEAIGDTPVVLVLDNLERLGEEPAAWTVIEAVARYAPPSMRIVFLSRHDVPPALCQLRSEMTAVVGEQTLAFTALEAAEALKQLGQTADVENVLEATGGWVTGVLFEGWRLEQETGAMGGEADPLNGYLSAHILAQLDTADREFLIATALLEEVDVPNATRLGQPKPADRLDTLRAAHLPVTWLPGGRTMRCHPCFREYLVNLLERRGDEELCDLRIAHGRLLADAGHLEEATDEFLRARALELAASTAERAIAGVVERLDFAVAERWLAQLKDVLPLGASAFATAELMLAIAHDDYARADAVIERLAAAGELELFAAGSERAAALVVWAAGTLDPRMGRELGPLLDVAPQGPVVQAVRYGLGTLEQRSDVRRPELTGSPTDALVLATDYAHGRLNEIVALPRSRWIGAVVDPWRIAALQTLGRTEEALELYRAAEAAGVAEIALATGVAPHLLLDAGLPDEAEQVCERGRELAERSGAAWYVALNRIGEAKLHLRRDRDTGAARAVLELADASPARRIHFIAELIDTWYGFALLLDREDVAARRTLQAAVGGMVAGDRILELPTAAIYLAESEWRMGDEDAADHAADLALATAQRQGSKHLLLQALRDFPAVASRRIDAEADVDSAWHELGRDLTGQASELRTDTRASVRLTEFGRPSLIVNGADVNPRLVKVYELLSLLATRPTRRAAREELLDSLFDGRNDASTRAYLRQVIQRLRRAMPDESAIGSDRASVWIADQVELSVESVHLQSTLREASRLHGAERLDATLAALAIADKGEYLPAARSGWSDARRRELFDLVTDARHQAAELAFSLGRHVEANELVTQVLSADRFREATWRLKMRLASALGDDDGVLAAFHGCEQALATLGTRPASSTRQLLEQLRR